MDMTKEREQLKAVEQIRRKYGKVIDLEKNPLVLVEIIRQHGRTFLEVGDHNLNPSVSTVAVGVNDGGGGGGGGGGGVSPGTSTVAVGITPPGSIFQRSEIEEVLRAVLKLQKQMDAMDQRIERIAKPR
jgi:hypothetical protein